MAKVFEILSSSVNPLVLGAVHRSREQIAYLAKTLLKQHTSDNEQIKSLAEDLTLINTCFWLTIIFSLLAFVRIIIHVSGKNPTLAQIIMLIGCGTLIFSILIVYLHWTLITKIENIGSISALLISSYAPIKYAHLPMIIGILSSIASLYYTVTVASFSVKNFMSTRKKKPAKKQPEQKTIEEQISEKKEEIATKEWAKEKKQKLPKEAESAKKIAPFEKGLFPKEPSIEELLSESEQEDPPESKELESQEQPSSDTEENYGSEEPHEKPNTEEEKPSEQETPSKTLQEQPSDSEEPPVQSPLFEQALSSAIEKRHTETDEDDANKNQQFEKKRVVVRCPECEKVFAVEKGEDITKIECPRCGKKGIAK